jgi:hypothetical protein
MSLASASLTTTVGIQGAFWDFPEDARVRTESLRHCVANDGSLPWARDLWGSVQCGAVVVGWRLETEISEQGLVTSHESKIHLARIELATFSV